MPKGPSGQRCPADVIGGAVKVMRIATGEEAKDVPQKKSAAAETGASDLNGEGVSVSSKAAP